MTELFLCVGIFLLLRRQMRRETDSTEKDIPIMLKRVGQYHKLEKAINGHVEEHSNGIDTRIAPQLRTGDPET